MELVFAEIALAEGRARVWSSSRGELETNASSWKDLFSSEVNSAGDPSARVMILLVGQADLVSDYDRERLIDSARSAGFGVVRIETGEPMEPEIAFELLALPFT